MPDIINEMTKESPKLRQKTTRSSHKSSLLTEKRPSKLAPPKTNPPKSRDAKRASGRVSRSSSSRSSSDSSVSSNSGSSASLHAQRKNKKSGSNMGQEKLAPMEAKLVEPKGRSDERPKRRETGAPNVTNTSREKAPLTTSKPERRKVEPKRPPTKEATSAFNLEAPKSRREVTEASIVAQEIHPSIPDVSTARRVAGEANHTEEAQPTVTPATSTKEPDSAGALQLPAFTRVMVTKLTRNVTKAHISEIFATWGEVASVEMPMDSVHPEFTRGFAYIEFTHPQAASDAVNFMNGGQIDGQEVNVNEVMPRPPRPPSPSHAHRHHQHHHSPDKGPATRDRERGAMSRLVRTENTSQAMSRGRESDRIRNERERDRPREHEREREKERDRRREIRAPERDRTRVGQNSMSSLRERDRAVEKESRPREQDRVRDRDRRRGSSGSPFAGHGARRRSPLTSRFRRPSPPSKNNTTAESRRDRSRSQPGRSAARGGASSNAKSVAKTNATAAPSNAPGPDRRRKTTKSSRTSSSSSDSSTSSGSSTDSSDSRSGSSSSSSASSR